MTRRRSGAALCAVALLWLAACGGASFGGRARGGDTRGLAQARPEPAVRPAPATLLRVRGAGTLALPRAVEGVVHLALFVDAGWRDATPPQLALATARIAATHGPGVVARVEPDLTEWSVACPRERMAACLAQLARVLALRDVTDAEAFAARRLVVDARRLALGDEARTADALAFAALWGVTHADAFGDEREDAQMTGTALARFAAAHYGPSRALFVAAGDVDATVLRDALAAALTAAPPATAARRPASSARAGDMTGVRVHVGETDAVSVVMEVREAGLARAIAARAQSDAPEEAEHLTAVALRGGGAVLWHRTLQRGAGTEPAAQAAAAFARLETARRELTRTVAVTPPDALDALARAHGRAFATGDAWPDPARDEAALLDAEPPAPLGVGVIVRGAPRRSLRGPDSDADLARGTETRVHSALEAATRALRQAGAVSGTEATLANGARLAVRPMHGATTRALTVRFAVDHGAEPASLHGRAALAAEALGVACREHAARAGLRLEARAAPGSFGFVATGTDDDALMALLECALHASPDEAQLDAARRRRVDALSPSTAPALHARVLAARALLPATPALLAPEGSAEGVAAVPAAEVRALLDASRTGNRTRVVWAGDGQAPFRAIARRLAQLAPGPAMTATEPGIPSGDDVLAATWRGAGLRAVVALRAATPEPRAARADAERAARAFAHALAGLLGEAPGSRDVAADGAALTARDVAAWIALELDETALEALPATLRSALAALTTTPAGRDAATAAEARLDGLERAALAVPSVAADRHAETDVAGAGVTPAPASGPLSQQVLDALAAAPWRVVVARPSRPAR